MIILAATPIGNLKDASTRLVEALEEATVIAAEDTRVTVHLLRALGVENRPRLIALHDHNERQVAAELVELARSQDVLVLSDAGMPTVSDPGFHLVDLAARAGVRVTALPGPSAVITALAVSGLPTDRFTFEGFLPRKHGERMTRLAQLAEEQRTMVFFESPNRLAAALADLAESFGDERRAVVCRELTKMFEEVKRGTMIELAQWASAGVRGEICLVVAGAEPVQVELADALVQVQALTAGGLGLKDAAGQVSQRTGLGRRELYQGALAARNPAYPPPQAPPQVPIPRKMAVRSSDTRTRVSPARAGIARREMVNLPAPIRMGAMADGSSFFVTTPIFYVNDVPHIGHAYTEVAADVLARWHRQAGDDTWLLTGTDEHGQKILRTAIEHNTTPKAWADKLVETAWLPLLDTLDISNDDFIRTTELRHEVATQKFLTQLRDAGYIYEGEYQGAYCVGCEEYKHDADLVNGTGDYAGMKVCAIHSKPVELLHEKNYFFRMSDFQQRLIDLYEQNPLFVQPEAARNEVMAFVRRGLDDLSISRSSFDWGIKVPWDDSHVVYVWFEALLNYVTASGYGQDEEQFARRWPATHLVGRDILRFHAVIWPAMLMAAGLPVPKQVFGHGWLLVGGEKMSKSKLTGIAPTEITDTFGSDAFRYYFMRAIGFGHDGSFSWEDLSARYQAELANGFGNLASRTLAMIAKYFDGSVPAPADYSEADLAIQAVVAEATSQADAAIERLAIHEAIHAIWNIVEELNGYITVQQPWTLAKDEADRERLGTVLYTAAEGLRALAVLLSPVMPRACTRLWAGLGAEAGLGELTAQNIRQAGQWGQLPAGTTVASLDSLFPRIEQIPTA